MTKDIQIFLGVQVKGQKIVANEMFSIDLYEAATNKKLFLQEALKHMENALDDKLKENDLI